VDRFACQGEFRELGVDFLLLCLTFQIFELLRLLLLTLALLCVAFTHGIGFLSRFSELC
jgi:hypothetical protein